MKRENKNYTDWWKNFFDSTWREILAPKNIQKQEIKILKNFLNREKIILDIGCGIGRFTLALAESGYEVYALDFSKPYLNILRKGVRKRRLKNRIKILHLDMRNLISLKKNFFDCALLMFNTFGYFSHKENVKLLKDIYSILKTGGKLIIQQSNFNFVNSNLKKRDGFETRKFKFLSENKWVKSKNRITIYTTWTIIDKNTKKVSNKIQRITLYHPCYLAGICKKIGFKLCIIKRIGNMDWLCFSKTL